MGSHTRWDSSHGAPQQGVFGAIHAPPSCKSRRCPALVGSAALMTLPTVAVAEDKLSAGDTAWVLTATSLVRFMTIPGLSLFTSVMVRGRNVLLVLMPCFALTALMAILGVFAAHRLGFEEGGMSSFIGGLRKAFCSGVAVGSLIGTTPRPCS